MNTRSSTVPNARFDQRISERHLHGRLKFTQDEQSLRATLPPEKPSDHAICFKIAI
jgi:hypothetical protein